MISNPLSAWVRHIRGLNAIRHHHLRHLRTLPPVEPGQIVGIIVARDEILRLPDCLRHHRSLGVDRFVVVDNGSTDGTTEYLCRQPDIDVIYTEDSFAEAGCGLDWQRYVVSRYGFGRWYLLIDCDELLVYDRMREYNLRQLAEAFKRRGITFLHATMIDMYRREPIGQNRFRSGDSMLATCPYFDEDSYLLEDNSGKNLMLRGGPRVRLMSTPERSFDNNISKYPFVFWHRGVYARSVHQYSAAFSRRSPSAALLHFKFLDDFAPRVEKAIRENQHWNESIEWKAYKDSMPAISNPYYEGSRKYEGPNSLLSMRLMTPIQYD